MFSVTFVGYHKKVVTCGKPRNWLILLVKLCDLSGNHHSLKSPCCISLIHKTFEAGPKTWAPFFTGYAWPRTLLGSRTIFYIHNNFLKDIPLKPVVPNLFVTSDQSILDILPWPGSNLWWILLLNSWNGGTSLNHQIRLLQ